MYGVCGFGRIWPDVEADNGMLGLQKEVNLRTGKKTRFLTAANERKFDSLGFVDRGHLERGM